MQDLINSTYEHKLAFCFHGIDKRGLLINVKKKENEVRPAVDLELETNFDYLKQLWGFDVYTGTNNDPKTKDALNINSHQSLLERLKFLGYNVPKIRKKNEETDQYELVDSVGELALVKTLADPNRWPSPNAGEGIKKLLECKEIITFRNRYLNARLHNNVYYSDHSVAATVTGRRGSKKSIFGFGGNDQNFPARGRLSGLWKECICSRPNKIFFFVDQVSAEDWPVQALAENYQALEEMKRGVNRHYIFASKIFNIATDDLKNARNNVGGVYTEEQVAQAEMQYYMGKKGRHANSYGLQPLRLSETLAMEMNLTVPVDSCKNILDIVDRIDPNVKRIFHKYIQECLASTGHSLRTPLGRERAFFGLRTGEKNYSILNEAYSYIPQSTVGDNTGLAVVAIENCYNYILQDGHDSLCQEVPDRESEIRGVFRATRSAFKRSITFHNGISIEIPLEGHLGYDWKHKVKLEEFTEECLVETYQKLTKEREPACA